MATPIMTHAELRRWLDGDWALFFSNPDDFACTGFEADRWQAVIHEAFRDAGVRPVAAFVMRAMQLDAVLLLGHGLNDSW